MRILLFIFSFFIIIGLVFVNNYNLHLYDKEDLKVFGDLYLGWFDNVYSNIFSITGHASKLDWFPSH
jgi:hypothetical protein